MFFLFCSWTDFISWFLSLSSIQHPHSSMTHPPLSFTPRLCQGLEWMMSRLRVRWWPLTLIQSASLLFVFFFVFFLPRNTNLNWGWGWGRLTDGPLLLSCDADVGRLLPGRCTITSDNLFYVCSELRTKTWPFQRDIGWQKRLKLFKKKEKFLHGFPSNKR